MEGLVVGLKFQAVYDRRRSSPFVDHCVLQCSLFVFAACVRQFCLSSPEALLPIGVAQLVFRRPAASGALHGNGRDLPCDSPSGPVPRGFDLTCELWSCDHLT